MSYTLTQAEYSALKGKLTRAIHSGSPTEIIAVAHDARLIFDSKGYPDDWNRWRIAVDDFQFDSDNDIRSAARAESDAWAA